MKILLVEDDPLIAKVFCRYLLRMRHEVEVRESSSLAVELLKQARFDFVLSDHELRDGPCGVLVIEYLREFDPCVPRCLMSGGFLVGESIGRGAYETFRRKPITPAIFNELVDWASRLVGQSSI